MTRSRVVLVVGLLVVLVVLAALLVRLLVWETTRPSPAAEGSRADLVAAAPQCVEPQPG